MIDKKLLWREAEKEKKEKVKMVIGERKQRADKSDWLWAHNRKQKKAPFLLHLLIDSEVAAEGDGAHHKTPSVAGTEIE